jgi:hypothetical protein
MIAEPEIGAFHAIVDGSTDIPWLSGAIPRLAAADDARFVDVPDRAFDHEINPSQAAAAITAMRRDIAAGNETACLALLGGAAAGAGAIQSAEGVCELVGIATLPEHRRRSDGGGVPRQPLPAHGNPPAQLRKPLTAAARTRISREVFSRG